jgi:uncharacterized membrane protein (UPF0127 family)
MNFLISAFACGLVSLSALTGVTAAEQVAILRPQSGAAVVRLSVEVAADAQSIQKGLSGRAAMPDDRGMLFLLRDREYVFWMKGMRYPLDFVVFDGSARVIEIIRDRQPCERCQLIRISAPAAYLLEINAGLAKKLGITKGDSLEIE